MTLNFLFLPFVGTRDSSGKFWPNGHRFEMKYALRAERCADCIYSHKMKIEDMKPSGYEDFDGYPMYISEISYKYDCVLAFRHSGTKEYSKHSCKNFYHPFKLKKL